MSYGSYNFPSFFALRVLSHKMSSRDSSRVFPTKTSPMKKASHKAPLTPSIHVATDLPCPADKDLDDIPRPKYTPSDIGRVQSILLHFVPVELADAIIDMAEYWPWVAVSRNSFTSAYSALEAPDSNAQWCYIVSPKIPSIERAGVCVPTVVKMVKFFIKTYESCYGKTKESKATGKFFLHSNSNPALKLERITIL